MKTSTGHTSFLVAALAASCVHGAVDKDTAISAEAMHRLLRRDTINFIPAPEGDGDCEEDLTEEELKAAKEFQKWFVTKYLGGDYHELKIDEEEEFYDVKKYQRTLDLFDYFDVDGNGYLDAEETAALEEFTGLDLDFLDKYIPCLYIDNLLDEDELLLAVCVGEPHFTTWQGADFDYHGECDLILIDNDEFDHGKGMDLHVRTEQIEVGQYSFVSDAALRLGSDTLEISKDGSIYHNQRFIQNPDEQFPMRVGDFRALYDHSSKCFDLGNHILHKCIEAQTVTVILGLQEKITIKVYKNMVHVEVKGRPEILGKNSRGLMGTSEHDGHGRVARDGVTEIHDANEFGQEWQVRSDEPKLFVEDRYPQFPQTCTPPTKDHFSERRLGQPGINAEEERLAAIAHEACAYLEQMGKDQKTWENCVFDVMATGDESVALLYGAF